MFVFVYVKVEIKIRNHTCKVDYFNLEINIRNHLASSLVFHRATRPPDGGEVPGLTARFLSRISRGGMGLEPASQPSDAYGYVSLTA